MSEIVATQTEEQPRNAVMTPAEMISLAVQNNSSIETITKLMDLQERYDATQARKAFDDAISRAKAEISPAAKDGTGHNKAKYATFASITSAIDKAATSFGLSYKFETEQKDGLITVTCIVSHKDGHSSKNSLSGPSDSTGSKNAIQAIGSTLTYLQRYALSQAFGLAASDQDDDGQAATETITADQAEAIKDEFAVMNISPAPFLKTFGVASVDLIPAGAHQAALNMLEIKKKNHLKELEQSND